LSSDVVLSPGALGKYARQMAIRLSRMGWVPFIKSFHANASINPNIRSAPHPAAPLLHCLARHGIPAPSMAPPWTLHK
jgi:hypothetical protein